MAFQIEDGKGQGYVCSVSDVNRLNVSAKSNPRIYYVSRDDQQAFTWVSDFNAASGNNVFYMRNTNASLNLFTEGTAGGTIVSGANLNRSSNFTPSASVYGNAAVTGLTNGIKMASYRTTANNSKEIVFDNALELGFNDAFSVSTAVAGSVSISCVGYFDKAR
jgi:hypothetical protein